MIAQTQLDERLGSDPAILRRARILFSSGKELFPEDSTLSEVALDLSNGRGNMETVELRQLTTSAWGHPETGAKRKEACPATRA